jgi:hypothetical protein
MSWRLGKNQIKISNRLAALENLNDSEGISRAWENIKANIKISAKESLGLYELKQHKTWFDEESLCFLDQRKQAKMHWVHDQHQSNVGNIYHVGHDAMGLSICLEEQHLKRDRHEHH